MHTLRTTETSEWGTPAGSQARAVLSSWENLDGNLTRVDLTQFEKGPLTTSFDSEFQTPEEFSNSPTRSADPNLGQWVTFHCQGSLRRMKLVALLGEGGMGRVYLARSSDWEGQAVVKIARQFRNRISIRQRFQSESETMQRVDHPNVIRYYDNGNLDSGAEFIAMERLAEQNVVQFANDLQLQLDGRLRLFQQICHGVQACHQLGIIHRDIKPANVMMSCTQPPRPKLIDFGIAKQLEGSRSGENPQSNPQQENKEGRLVGTLQYMSPEQAGGADQSLGIQSDIYSLGVLLYELVSGEPPLSSDSMRDQSFDAIVEKIQKSTSPTLTGSTVVDLSKAPGMVEGLELVFSRTITPHVEDRYESVERLILEVSALQSNALSFVEAAKPTVLPKRIQSATATRGIRTRCRQALALGLMVLLFLSFRSSNGPMEQNARTNLKTDSRVTPSSSFEGYAQQVPPPETAPSLSEKTTENPELLLAGDFLLEHQAEKANTEPLAQEPGRNDHPPQADDCVNQLEHVSNDPTRTHPRTPGKRDKQPGLPTRKIRWLADSSNGSSPSGLFYGKRIEKSHVQDHALQNFWLAIQQVRQDTPERFIRMIPQIPLPANQHCGQQPSGSNDSRQVEKF